MVLVLHRVVAIVAVLVGAWLRPDAAVGLIVLGVIFVIWEHHRPARPQPTFRTGFATDCAHFLADEVLAATMLAVALVVLVPAIAWFVPDVVVATTRAQPTLLVFMEAALLAEVAGYWGHRLTHQIPFLWRFHELHHTIERMDWLAPNRRHPVDMTVARLSVIIPLLAFGFTVPAIGAHFAFKRFQGLLVHANVRLDAGVLTWLIATPEFHHWHHAREPEARNKNFAGQLPLVDRLFGTLHLPRPNWPKSYGCDVTPPAGYVAQLAWPFRRGGEVARAVGGKAVADTGLAVGRRSRRVSRLGYGPGNATAGQATARSRQRSYS